MRRVEDVEANADGQVLRLRFFDGSWDVCFPAEWVPAASDEDDLWCWAVTGVATARVRLRRRPHIQIEVDLMNSGDAVTVAPPTVEYATTGAQVPWVAGSAGEIVSMLPHSTVLWTQQRGSCTARGGRAFSLFPEPLMLRSGQGASAAWRRHVLPVATLPPEPVWVPRKRYFRRDELLEVDHSDAALMGLGMEIGTTADGSAVQGPPGLHDLAFLDARGTALVEVGWFEPLQQLAASALRTPSLDAGLRAWLLSCVAEDDRDLDALDIALAETLEQPSAWSVLAGMRAATLTDLPVAADVRRAAHILWRTERDEQLRRLLVTHAVLTGWEPGVAAQWLQSIGSGTGVPEPWEVLSSIGLGRVTSAPLGFGGREVAMAGMWLASCGESAMAAEWEHAIDTSRARLLCFLSGSVVAVDVAWLLAETLLA